MCVEGKQPSQCESKYRDLFSYATTKKTKKALCLTVNGLDTKGKKGTRRRLVIVTRKCPFVKLKKQRYRHLCKKTTTSVPQTNNNFQRKLIDLASFSCYFERIKSQHNLLFFFHVPVEQLLNPSVHLASLTGLGSCTRPLLMPVDCL